MENKKDKEFDKIILDLHFNENERLPDFVKMKSILEQIKTYTVNEQIFARNISHIRKLLYTLGTHIFSLQYKQRDYLKNPPEISIDGSHDYNTCLAELYFDWWLWKEYYSLFCKDVTILIHSEGIIYPRIIHELRANTCAFDKNNPNKRWYKVITKILVRRKDMPIDKKFDKCNYGKVNKGKYHPIYKKLATIEEHKKAYTKLLKGTYTEEEIEKIFKEDMEREYTIWKELSDNYDKYIKYLDVQINK